MTKFFKELLNLKDRFFFFNVWNCQTFKCDYNDCPWCPPTEIFFFLNINTYNLAVGFESEYFKNEYEQLLFKSKSYSGDNILKKISGNVFTLIEFCYWKKKKKSSIFKMSLHFFFICWSDWKTNCPIYLKFFQRHLSKFWTPVNNAKI